MEKGIKISSKYGANPTIAVCFWCGQATDKIALLGRVRTKTDDDIETPMYSVIDYEPCDKCLSIMKEGCTLIGVKTTATKLNMPITRQNNQDLYPAGDLIVLKDKAIHDIFTPDIAETIIDKRCAFLDSNAMAELQAMMPCEKETNNS